MNEPVNMIVRGLAAGAVINMRPNSSALSVTEEACLQEWIALKLLIDNHTSHVDVDLLDIGPGSAERKEKLAQQLEDTQAAQDEEIVRQAQKLLKTITAKEPEALWAAQVAEPPAHLK